MGKKKSGNKNVYEIMAWTVFVVWFALIYTDVYFKLQLSPAKGTLFSVLLLVIALSLGITSKYSSNLRKPIYNKILIIISIILIIFELLSYYYGNIIY